jgi:hypothetical protein
LNAYAFESTHEIHTCNASVQRWSRSQFGTGNGFNLGALYAHPQQQVARRNKAVVVRASEVAVKEESGSPSLGLEVVETIEPNSRVNTNPSPFFFFVLQMNLQALKMNLICSKLL